MQQACVGLTATHLASMTHYLPTLIRYPPPAHLHPNTPKGIRGAEEALAHALSDLGKQRAHEERRLAERLKWLHARTEQEKHKLARAYEQQVLSWLPVTCSMKPK